MSAATKEIEVIALTAAYFEKKPVLDPTGEQVVNPDTNQKVFVTTRHTAKRKERLTISEFEANRLIERGAAREPSTDPFPGDLPYATPFGMPIKTDNDSDMYYTGPVMGDPTPGGQVTATGQTVGGLTPEEARRIEEEHGLTETDDPPEFVWSEDTTSEQVGEYVTEHNLNTEQTLALALDDDGENYNEERAADVLEAELSREEKSRRKGVVEPLEKIVESN